MHDVLLDAGVEDSGRMDFGKPKLGEILAALHSVPAILPLMMRKELQSILCNVMVLEWVIREEIAHRIPGRILTRSDATFFGHWRHTYPRRNAKPTLVPSREQATCKFKPNQSGSLQTRIYYNC